MRLGEIGWGVFLAGLPWAHLVFYGSSLDLWASQSTWVWGGLPLLWGLGLAWGQRAVPNWPLGAFLAWCGWHFTWQWTQGVMRHEYLHPDFLVAMLPLMALGLLYQSATSLWTRMTIVRLLRWMAWSGLVVLGYCGLQLLNMDQFLSDFHQLPETRDHLVGVVGNPSHLAAHLGFLLILFLLQPSRWWWVAAGVAGIVLGLTGKVSGLILLTSAGMMVAICRGNRWVRWLVPLGMAGGLGLLLWRYPQMLESHGRWAAWQTFAKFLEHGSRLGGAITGFGQGFIAHLSTQTPEGSPIHQWRHVHNAYLQLWLQQGIIGLGIVLWGLTDVLRRVWKFRADYLVVGLGCLFAAFCANGLTNFPDHLWVLAMYGFVAYAAIYVLTTEESVWQP